MRAQFYKAQVNQMYSISLGTPTLKRRFCSLTLRRTSLRYLAPWLQTSPRLCRKQLRRAAVPLSASTRTTLYLSWEWLPKVYRRPTLPSSNSSYSVRPNGAVHQWREDPPRGHCHVNFCRTAGSHPQMYCTDHAACVAQVAFCQMLKACVSVREQMESLESIRREGLPGPDSV